MKSSYELETLWITQCLFRTRISPSFQRFAQNMFHHETYAIALADLIVLDKRLTENCLEEPLFKPKLKSWREEVPNTTLPNAVLLERLFQLLGKNATRNLVLMKQWVPGNSVSQFGQFFVCALAAEDKIAQLELPFVQEAFFSGLFWDLCMMLFPKNNKVIKACFDAAFTKAAQKISDEEHWCQEILFPLGDVLFACISGKNIEKPGEKKAAGKNEHPLRPVLKQLQSQVLHATEQSFNEMDGSTLLWSMVIAFGLEKQKGFNKVASLDTLPLATWIQQIPSLSLK